jgi:bacillithiol biosynthesis cysteine-adding enzyme BshC
MRCATAESSVTEPRVVTLPFDGQPLVRAALEGETPAAWYERAPRTASEWTNRSRELAADASVREWRATLAPAFAAQGAAAARLDRSAEGRGVVVTTGQQPGLFGGPIYTWNKALSALALADAIERETKVPAAPVFWAATYDADFAESSASYVILNGAITKLQLPLPDRPDTAMRDTPLGDVAPLLRLLELASGSAVKHDALDAVRAAYAPEESIGGAYVRLLRALREPLGIAGLDARHPPVRLAARPLLARALERAQVVDDALTARESELDSRGFEPAVTHGRGLSTVFRYANGTRTRIQIAGASTANADDELEPNVILRPVAERAILPAVAYLGGPGEVAYFAQSTAIAQALGAAAPVVLPRWSGMIIEPHVQRLLARHHLAPDDLRDPHAAESRLVRAQLPDGVRDALARYSEGAASLNDALRRALASDGASPLVPDTVLDGVRNNVAYRLERLERRIVAGAKRREAAAMHDIAVARSSLYPHGKPQERVLNFIPMLARHGQPLLDMMRARANEHAAALLANPGTPSNERVAAPR